MRESVSEFLSAVGNPPLLSVVLQQRVQNGALQTLTRGLRCARGKVASRAPSAWKFACVSAAIRTNAPHK